MKSYRIALLPGDGVGPHVIAEGMKVLRVVERQVKGIKFEATEFLAGAALYQETGIHIAKRTLELCREHDAVLVGTPGLPEVRRSNGTSVCVLDELRQTLELHTGLYPMRLHHGTDSPLRGYGAGTLDFVIVQANLDGIVSPPGAAFPPDAEAVDDTFRVSRANAERVFQVAFEQACRRRKIVTLVDKASTMRSMAYFRRVFDDVARAFPTVRTERLDANDACLHLLQRPHALDVVVAGSLLGDLLAHIAAGLVGGTGLAARADIGDHHAVFGPLHGPMPELAGKGTANPIAAILSVSLMLDWLRLPETISASNIIAKAVAYVLSQPQQRTRDMGGALSTAQMGDHVVRAMELQGKG